MLGYRDSRERCTPRVHQLRLALLLLLALTMTASLLPMQSAGADVQGRNEQKYASQSVCVNVRAALSHGPTNWGQAESRVTSKGPFGNIWCNHAVAKDPGWLAVGFRYFKWNGNEWVGVASTGNAHSFNRERARSHSWDQPWSDTQGAGWFGLNSNGWVWDGQQWQGGTTWSGYHWFPA